MTEPNEPRPTPRGLKVVAFAVLAVSLIWLLRDPTNTGLVDAWTDAFASDPILASLRLGAVGAGIATAVGLFSGKYWSLWLYLAWFALYLSATVVSDARAEPVVWKVAVGAGLVSILPACGALYLFSAGKRMT